MAHAADGRKEWLHFTIDSHEKPGKKYRGRDRRFDDDDDEGDDSNYVHDYVHDDDVCYFYSLYTYVNVAVSATHGQHWGFTGCFIAIG